MTTIVEKLLKNKFKCMALTARALQARIFNLKNYLFCPLVDWNACKALARRQLQKQIFARRKIYQFSAFLLKFAQRAFAFSFKKIFYQFVNGMGINGNTLQPFSSRLLIAKLHPWNVFMLQYFLCTKITLTRLLSFS